MHLAAIEHFVEASAVTHQQPPAAPIVMPCPRHHLSGQTHAEEFTVKGVSAGRSGGATFGLSFQLPAGSRFAHTTETNCILMASEAIADVICCENRSSAVPSSAQEHDL